MNKRLLQLETQLFESLSNARKLYSSKIPIDIFDKLVSIDPSKTFKYIEKICKFYLELGGKDRVNFEGLKYQIDLFDKLSSKNLIDKKDINSFKSIWEFEDYLSDKSDRMSKSEERNLIKNEGSEVILNNPEFLVLLIKDEKASIQYGAGTKWCISAKDSQNFFKKYRVENKITFYFIFQKNLDSSNPNYKIAVSVWPDGDKDVYDSKDKKIEFSEVQKLGFKEELFVPVKFSKNEILDNCVSGTWEINSKGEIDVEGDVNFDKINSIFEDIGQFGTVTGNFYCNWTGLKTLKGSPHTVNGEFNCSDNSLTSLKYSPNYVGKGFNCVNNYIRTLNHSPKYVGKSFSCSANNLLSLDGITQEIGEGIHCSENRLISLRGSPKIVNGSFWCYENNLENLEGSPEIVKKDFHCYANKLISIKGTLKKVGDEFRINNNFKKFTKEEVESQIEVIGRIFV